MTQNDTPLYDEGLTDEEWLELWEAEFAGHISFGPNRTDLLAMDFVRCVKLLRKYYDMANKVK